MFNFFEIIPLIMLGALLAYWLGIIEPKPHEPHCQTIRYQHAQCSEWGAELEYKQLCEAALAPKILACYGSTSNAL